MVESRELKCYEYICAIKDIEKTGCSGLYGLDAFRERIHDELCDLFNLDKDETKRFTDNMDVSNPKAAELLYFSLLNLSKDNNRS